MHIRPIRTTADLSAAKAELAKLIAKPGDANDKIEVLAVLIEQYEENYFPIDIPDPIAAIKYRMSEKGLTARDLEPYVGSRARVSEVLSGKRQLSIDMIRSLHEGLGIPYDALISDRRSSAANDRISAPAVQRMNALGFDLDQRDVPIFISTSLRKSAPFALLRKTRTQRASSKTDQNALLLWQSAVLRKSESRSSPYRADALSTDVLRQIARMSAKVDGPVRAVRTLSELGISVVIMPSLPGTFLDGAAMANPTGHPVIGLTLRNDRTDNFWFTLLHECAHIALHFGALADGEAAFIDDMEIKSEDTYEREADMLARESLIPSDILGQVSWGANTTLEDLKTLTTRARVHPAVVAGRWQRDHQNYKRFSRLIERNAIRAMFDKSLRLA